MQITNLPPNGVLHIVDCPRQFSTLATAIFFLFQSEGWYTIHDVCMYSFPAFYPFVYVHSLYDISFVFLPF